LEPRFTFDRIAGLYDAARAGYPDVVLERLSRLAGPGRSVLEIGCGGGKATIGLPVARRRL
jgi:ubiquinone/menaquinone biosynthesis C-methylase UbiE